MFTPVFCMAKTQEQTAPVPAPHSKHEAASLKKQQERLAEYNAASLQAGHVSFGG
jgi:hypothetical protein